MKSLLFILAGLFVSWHYTDLSAEGVLNRMVAPLGVLVFLAALAVWLVVKAGFDRRVEGGGGLFSGDGGFDGDGGGGD